MPTPNERLASLAASLTGTSTVPIAQVPHTHVKADVTDLSTHAHVHGEQFTGTGVLTQFTLAHAPLYGVTVFVAGVRTDVSVSSALVTFGVAPVLNAVIRVNYEW